MKRNKTFFNLIATALSVVLLISCDRQKEESGGITKSDSVTEEIAEAPHGDSVTLPEEVIMEEIQWHLDHGNIQEAEQWQSMLPHPVELKPAQEKTNQKKQPSATKSVNNGGTGQKSLYISTYGANGKVWGHVRMNGNTGRGTIHDDDENTLAITVTRHGNELFGTDQNGRQYVFKL